MPWAVMINVLDAANNDAAWFEILSAEVFDSEDVPSPDNFIQKNAHRPKCSKHMSAVDDGEQYEYGEVEAHAIDADTSDFSSSSPDNFIQLIDDNTQDAANNVDARSNPQQVEYIQQTQVLLPDNFIQRSKNLSNNDAARPTILSAEVFDNDDVPSTDNFLQNTIDADT